MALVDDQPVQGSTELAVPGVIIGKYRYMSV
jgi:hypothetical protein